MPFLRVADLPSREMIPGYTARVVHGERMSQVFWEVRGGCAMPEYSHPHEQFANNLEGEFELVVAGEKRRLAPGEVAVIPPNARHGGRAITDCRLLDVFCPTPGYESGMSRAQKSAASCEAALAEELTSGRSALTSRPEAVTPEQIGEGSFLLEDWIARASRRRPNGADQRRLLRRRKHQGSEHDAGGTQGKTVFACVSSLPV